MENFHPSKLSLEKVLTLTPTNIETELGLTAIRKLIMFDHSAHIITLPVRVGTIVPKNDRTFRCRFSETKTSHFIEAIKLGQF